MNSRYAIALAAVAALAVALGYAMRPDPVDEAALARAEVVERIERSDAGEAHDHHGQGVDPARQPPTERREGIARDDVSRVPPLDDEAKWQQQRARSARELRDSQIAATRAFAEAEGLTDAETEAIVVAVDTLHVRLWELKQQVELGNTTPAELRSQTPLLRDRTARDVRAAIGPIRAASLRSALADADLGGGF